MFPLISGDSASNNMVDGKFTGFTCSQLKVEISHRGDNTSVRKNYATDVST